MDGIKRLPKWYVLIGMFLFGVLLGVLVSGFSKGSEAKEDPTYYRIAGTMVPASDVTCEVTDYFVDPYNRHAFYKTCWVG